MSINVQTFSTTVSTITLLEQAKAEVAVLYTEWEENRRLLHAAFEALPGIEHYGEIPGRIKELLRELGAAERERDEWRDCTKTAEAALTETLKALRMLYEEKHGPPLLLKWEGQWLDTMQRVVAVLQRYERPATHGEEGKR